jgi:hypothetical protein
MLAVAGCQSGTNAKKPDSGVLEPPPPPSTRITESELRAYCPAVTLREGTAFYTVHAKGAKKKKPSDEQEVDPGAPPDEGADVVYQASIDNVTRACNYHDGVLTMTVAVAGKIVPGPLAKVGKITMPIRVAVLQGDNVLYSKLAQYSVDIADTSSASQFLYSDPEVTFPRPTARDIQVFAGYDEGPADKKKRK